MKDNLFEKIESLISRCGKKKTDRRAFVDTLIIILNALRMSKNKSSRDEILNYLRPYCTMDVSENENQLIQFVYRGAMSSLVMNITFTDKEYENFLLCFGPKNNSNKYRTEPKRSNSDSIFIDFFDNENFIFDIRYKVGNHAVLGWHNKPSEKNIDTIVSIISRDYKSVGIKLVKVA